MAKAHAEELAAITSAEEFYATIKLEIAKVTAQRENETAEQYQERLDALHASAFSEFTSVSGLGTEIKEWAKAAKVGDTYVDGVEGATKFTVYMLANTPYRNEKMSRDVRHIFFISSINFSLFSMLTSPISAVRFHFQSSVARKMVVDRLR